MELQEIKNILKNNFSDYNISEIKIYDDKYYVFLDKSQEFDIPVLWFSKDGDKKGVLDRTDKLAFEIMKNGETINGEDSEDTEMEAEQIRNLLKLYGAEDKEIENFMNDLYETKDEMKDEEEDFNYLDGDTIAKLKATKEGQDLIINAPKMAKDELKKAIMEYLSKQC